MASRAALVDRAPQPVTLLDSGVEALKWLGLALMLLDHVNTHLLDGGVAWMYAAGRVVMPLFGMLLAYNLARGVPGAAWRTARRTLVFGLLATPPFWALHGTWWPLNIMFTLSAAAATIALLQQRQWPMAVGLSVVAGGLVEFCWPALLVVLGTYGLVRVPRVLPAALDATAWVLGMAGLCVINANLWALAAVPLIALASRTPLGIPRLRWVFYVAYPMHLLVLWALK